MGKLVVQPDLFFPRQLKRYPRYLNNNGCTLHIELDTRPQSVREGVSFPLPLLTRLRPLANRSHELRFYITSELLEDLRGEWEKSERWKLVMVVAAARGAMRLAVTIINGRRLAIEKGISDEIGAAVEGTHQD